jgi:iron complex outermembrane receptor protein
MKLKYMSILVMLPFVSFAMAETFAPVIEMVEVTAEKLSVNVIGLDEDDIVKLRASTNDTASLLEGLPGLSLYGAGGVSSLPAIHGMADDRLRIQVDGMNLVSACANHMNPPLSYIDPANLGAVEVFAGITPVSVGGDSIGGTIRVTSPAPEFAMPGQENLLNGQLGIFYRSNGNVKGGNASATMANERLSVTYTGSYVESGNYYAAEDFKSSMNPAQTAGTVRVPDPDEVGSSLYKSINHALRVALRHDNHLFKLKLGLQDIPYQGFPNQRMDMTDNEGKHVNLSYAGQYQWGVLEARAFHENTRHKMNFLDEKLQKMNPAGMPMDTEGITTGADIKADIILSGNDVLRLGSEYQSYGLDDWWDPIGPWAPGPQVGKGMRGDSPFWNINNGKRDRFDVFVEWEKNLNQKWLSQIGLRSSNITMNTGDVRGYNTVPENIKGGYGDPTDPTTIPGAFNARDHKRTDHNIDFTALLSYTPTAGLSIEGGYARKVRSPNLYERYAWSTTNTMIMNMVNWSGEANGYVGNPDLDPEVANTLSVTLEWIDPAEQNWGLRITPYYTYIDDYIDVQRCSGGANFSPCTDANVARPTGFVYLQFVNQSARIYGVDISGNFVLANGENYGRFVATGLVNFTDGENRDTNDGLYNIMPLNATLAIEHSLGNWSNTLEWQLVDDKNDVSDVRNELETDAYSLLNLRSSYAWTRLRFDFGIENIFDKFYAHPLGGAYVGEGNVMGGGATWGIPVPAMGRTVFAGVTMKF